MKRTYSKPEAETMGTDVATGLLAVSGDLYGGPANAAELPDVDEIGRSADEWLDGFLLKE